MPLNPDRLTATFIELCRVPSPSGREGRVANYVRRRVAALGLAVEEDDAGPVLGGEVGNLIVRCPGQGEPLFLAAHMDTVPVSKGDEVPVVVEGDRVHTAGRSPLGGDDKAGVAVALEMLAAAVEAGQRCRPLEVIFTVQEEQGARGACHFDPQRLQARQGFNLDGETAVGTAIRQAPYKVRFHVEVRGRRAHAAVEPEKGINAIQALGAVAAALPTGRLDEITVANLGYIEGGGPINVVPDRARLVGELRSMERAALEAIMRQVEETVQREATCRGATASTRWEELYAGYCVPDDALCVVLFTAACRAEGLEPRLLSSMGGGDANPFNNKGLTCIVFGLGMEAIHTEQESMRLGRLIAAGRLLHRIVGSEAIS